MPTQDYVTLSLIVAYFAVFVVTLGAIQLQTRTAPSESGKQ